MVFTAWLRKVKFMKGKRHVVRRAQPQEGEARERATPVPGLALQVENEPR